MREYLLSLTALAVIGLFAAGCKSDSTSPAPPIHSVSPGVGSSFLYYALTIDSIGRVIVNMDTLYGDTVLATGISQYGKTNVTQYTPNFLFQYVNYETNGNLSYYVNPGAGQTSQWITVPMDSMGTLGSLDPNMADSTWYSATGVASLTLADQQFIAESFDVYSGPAAMGIEGLTLKEWYDTTTGVLLEQNTLAVRDSAGQFGTGKGFEIAKFTVK
jgi:hypothetical protein